MRVVVVGVAGFFGAIARYALEGFVSERARGAFPLGTWVVNISGCVLLGLLFTLFTERFLVSPTLRTALTVGFLGAYTTFSTFAFETVRLASDGAILLAMLNVGASLIVGVAGAWVGIVLGRAV